MGNNNSKRIKRVLRVLVTVLLTTSFSANIIITSQAATVNDVRELLGRQRLEEDLLQKEIEDLAEQYLTAELNNVAAEMFVLGEKIDRNPEVEAKQLDLARRVQNKSDELYNSFVTNAPVQDVLSIRTQLESTMSEVNKLSMNGYSIDIEFAPNKWSDIYIEVQERAKKYDTSFDIGVVGGEMKSAVDGRLEVSSPFGKRWDPIDKGRIGIHKGLDLNADMNQNILAQWNGIVTNVYESKGYGKTIEIQHGKGLKTRYAHLNKQLVKIGDTVSQYDVIGLAGSTGRSTGPHLHIEVYVDEILANPIMIYGKKGMDAYYKWAQKHPGAIINDTDVKEIKDKATGGSQTEEKSYEPGFYNPIPKEYSNKPDNIPPGVIVPSLPDEYKRPEPGVIQ